MALLLTALHRSGAGVLHLGASAMHPFAAGTFAGMALAAISVALFCAKDGYRASHSRWMRVALPLLACALLVVGVAGAGAQEAVVVAGLAWNPAALAAGAGLTLLALPYGLTFGALCRRDALVAMSFGLLATVLLDCGALLLPTEASLVLGAAEALVTAGLPVTGPRRAPGEEPDASPTQPRDNAEPVGNAANAYTTFRHIGAAAQQTTSAGPDPSPAARLKALAADTWRPVVGALICLFIFGFTWDTGLLGVQLNEPGAIVFEKVAGLALAGTVLLGLARLAPHHDPLAVLFNAVLPLLVVTFIVRPYLLSLNLGPLALNALGIARETGFVLFLAAAWLALTQGARRRDVSTTLAASSLLASCGAAGLLGLYGPQFLGGLLNYMGAILFTLYLVVVVVVSTVSQHVPSPTAPASSPDVPAPDLGSLVEQRCEQVALEHGLTPREREIVLYLGRGHSYAYIANVLTVSENTVRTHVRNIYRKLDVTSREGLLAVVHGEVGNQK